jgi:hypothetical protein
MRKTILGCLLWLTYHAASSQVAPIAPRVVRLEAGTTLRRTWVGMDTATYQQVRRMAERAQLLEESRTLDGQQIAGLRAEVLRGRAQVDLCNKEYDTLAGINRQLAAQPRARPLLLDPHPYAGAGAGAALLLLYLILHP